MILGSIGLYLIFSAIVIGATFLFGFNLELKEKVLGIAGFEIFLLLIIAGAQLIEYSKP